MPSGRPPTWYYLATGIFPYLVAFACATTVLVIWQQFLRVQSDDLSLETLIMLESRTARFSSLFADYVKPNEVTVALVLLALLVLSWRARATVDRHPLGYASTDRSTRVLDSAQRVVAVYTRYSGPVAAFLAVLAAVTLLGNEAGRSASDLQLRIKTAESGYALIAERTEALLAERVTTSAFNKVYDALPPDYRGAMTLPATIDEVYAELERHAAAARRDHTVSSTEVEQLLADERRRQAARAGVEQHVSVRAPSRTPDVPKWLTRTAIETARSSATARPAEPIDLVRDAHRAYTLQIEKVVTERIGQALKPLSAAFPIVEPVVNALIDSLDQAFQERLGRAYDRLMEVAVTRPDSFAGELDRAARTVVDGIDVGPAARHAAALGEPHAVELRSRLDALQRGPALVDAAVDEELRRRAMVRTKPSPGELLPLPTLRPPAYPDPSVDSWRPGPRYSPPRSPVAPNPSPRPGPRGGLRW